ncbi:hypothetical protein NE237_013506 [Protea cynaroides]|uniref:Uncharacterized protein n=1 Tax=Protea cynaroides TaxID=273540 RepID=A0A9Q0H1U3_9MAGN|nr:hypothetical protein NE237_013506 [Protea cynaroides]
MASASSPSPAVEAARANLQRRGDMASASSPSPAVEARGQMNQPSVSWGKKITDKGGKLLSRLLLFPLSRVVFSTTLLRILLFSSPLSSSPPLCFATFPASPPLCFVFSSRPSAL